MKTYIDIKELVMNEFLAAQDIMNTRDTKKSKVSRTRFYNDIYGFPRGANIYLAIRKGFIDPKISVVLTAHMSRAQMEENIKELGKFDGLDPNQFQNEFVMRKELPAECKPTEAEQMISAMLDSFYKEMETAK